MRNAYAAKITAARSALKNAERASAVALNEQFGFGADRIARYRDAMEKTIIEYGALMDSTDAEYADGKLEERYLQIMGGSAIE